MNVSALLAAIAVGGAAIAVVTRPASAFARRYVSDLEQDRARTGATSSRDATTEPREFRALWLLTPTSQGILAAVLCAATLVRGAAGGAWGEVIVALPLVALLGAALTPCATGSPIAFSALRPCGPAQQPWLLRCSTRPRGRPSPKQAGQPSGPSCAQ